MQDAKLLVGNNMGHVLPEQALSCTAVRADTKSSENLFHALTMLHVKNDDLIFSEFRAFSAVCCVRVATGFHGEER